jgi:Ribbon-helix-helix protein, copG family
VTVQARVDADFARELERDAAVLGLRGRSEVVREGLRLVHMRARELAMEASYEEFYGHDLAPVSEVTAALWSE